MRRALLALLALAPLAVRAQPLLLAGAAVSGTWDSNVTRSAQAEGGLFLDATAHLGGGLPLADARVLLTGLVLYRWHFGTTAGALSSHVLVASLVGAVGVVDWLQLGVSGGAGYTAMSDPARDGPRADARLFARAMPLDWLDVKAGGGWLYRGAAEEAFTSHAWEVSAGLELRPLAWLELGAGWAYTSGGDVVFVASGGGTSTAGRGRYLSDTGAEAAWTPTPVEARTHALSATATALLPHGLGIGVELGWQTSSNSLEPWTGWVGTVSCAWDLP